MGSKTLSKEEIEEIVGSKSLSKEEIEEIVGSKSLSKEEIEEIVGSRSLSKEEIEEIVGSKALSKEEIEEIVGSKALSKEDVEAIVGSKTLSKEEIEEVVGSKTLNKEEIESIIKNEILNVDYAKELKQIEEMISTLKDSYLELSTKLALQENKLDTQIQEAEVSSNKPDNIIDIRELKKEKQAKEEVSFSINEDILFNDLEETAYCIMPLTGESDSAENITAR